MYPAVFEPLVTRSGKKVVMDAVYSEPAAA